MGEPLPSGAATAIGSVPHADAVEAARFALDATPLLPACPARPLVEPSEAMVSEVLGRFSGARVRGGELVVDPGAFAPANGRGWSPPRSLTAFLDQASDRRGPLKLQAVGPVTLGMSLVAGGAESGEAFDAAATAVGDHVVELVAVARQAVGPVPLLLTLDEPSIQFVPRDGLTTEAALRLIAAVRSRIEPDEGLRWGLHCCGPADWGALTHAPLDVLFAPVGSGIERFAAPVADHLDRGGWIGWGVVPTSGPIGSSEERLWDRLIETWRYLVDSGCDPERLVSQCLVSPECGLAAHGVSQAALALDLTTRISDRIAQRAPTLELIS